MTECHRASIEAGTKQKVIDFLRRDLDPGLVNIEMVDEFERFIVSHDDFRPMDLSAYGEGMRRIFHTCLLFAGAQHGVVLIDEFENAIHFGLLPRFARFVQRLAEEFDVQVFLTTHSQEAIDAFVVDNPDIEGVVGFGLVESEGEITVDRVDGVRLARLIDVLGFDLRGAE